MEGSVSVNIRNLAVKCRSKKELYSVLQSDCEVYMPPIEFANADYWRGIVTGKIKVIFFAFITQLISMSNKESWR